MDFIFCGSNSVWKVLGSALLIFLASVCIYQLVQLVRQEIRWWRKKRDYHHYLEEEQGRK